MSDAEGYQAIAEAEQEAASHRPAERSLGQKLRLPLMIGGPLAVAALPLAVGLGRCRLKSPTDKAGDL